MRAGGFRRGAVGLLAGSVMAGAVLVTPQAATGAAAGSVQVPRNAADVGEVTLLGASGTGFAVGQGDLDPAGTGSTIRVSTGGPGSALTHRGDFAQSGSVAGRYFYRAESTAVSGAESWVVHRYDLLTGKESTEESTDKPLAWTPDGWIGYSGAVYYGTGTLSRHVFGGKTSTLVTGIYTGTFSSYTPAPAVHADGTGALVDYDVVVQGERVRRLALITFGTPGMEVLLNEKYVYEPQFIFPRTTLEGAGLSEDTLAWVALTTVTGAARVVSVRPRAGGAVTTTTFGSATTGAIAVAGSRVGTLNAVDGDTSGSVRILSGSTWRTVTLPAAASGLGVAAGEFVTAVNGPAATAGVYSIGTGDAARVATLSPLNSRFADVSLSAGRVGYVDTSISAVDGRGSVWQRTVGRDDDGALALGPQSRMIAVSSATGTQALARKRSVLSVSAGRAVVEPLAASAGTLLAYDLVDRTLIDHTFTFGGRNGFRLRASGPYALVERRVYRADGKLLLDLGADAVHSDLYGSSVIYSAADGSVRVRDLGRAASASNPRTLAARHCSSGCAGQVAIWGTTMAWTRKDGALLVRTLPAAKVRVVKPLTHVFDLRLSEGALSWHTASGSLVVLNLRSATSRAQAVALTGAEVDDHLIAGITGSGGITVRTLPFGLTTAYRPRLIGVLGATSFSPDGDGTGDVWAPEFDLTKPVSSLRLAISRDGDVVRTLAASAPDGSVRGVVWDGRDEFGTAAPAGAYTWRLTGESDDGEGTLTAVDGRSTAAGKLTLAR